MNPRPPDRFEELLTRAFDGEISPDERRELDALADVEPRLVAFAELRAALRDALAAPGPVDVVEEVMAVLAVEDAWTLGDAMLGEPLRAAVSGEVDLADAIFAGIDAEAAWAPLGASLREALAAPAIDVADAVMGAVDEDAAWAGVAGGLREALAAPAIDVSDAVLAEIAAEAEWAPVGAALRDAVTAPKVDVWAGVADGIGVERDAVHGWEAVAKPLREAFAALPEIDVAGAVMAAIEPAVSKAPRMPLWASLGAPLVAFAAAAAMLFAVVLPAGGPDKSALSAQLRVGTVNDAQVEEVTAAEDVVVQVMQFEDGGPTFILVDDPSGSGVPL